MPKASEMISKILFGRRKSFWKKSFKLGEINSTQTLSRPSILGHLWHSEPSAKSKKSTMSTKAVIAEPPPNIIWKLQTRNLQHLSFLPFLYRQYAKKTHG
jgi:hypothetical protein